MALLTDMTAAQAAALWSGLLILLLGVGMLAGSWARMLWR